MIGVIPLCGTIDAIQCVERRSIVSRALLSFTLTSTLLCFSSNAFGSLIGLTGDEINGCLVLTETPCDPSFARERFSSPGTLATAIVGPGVEFTSDLNNPVDPNFDLFADFTADTLTLSITRLTPCSATGGCGSGGTEGVLTWVFGDLDWNVPGGAIPGLELVSISGFTGVSLPSFTISAHEIAITTFGRPLPDMTDLVTYRIAAPIPEPTSTLLFAVGSLVMGGALSKKRFGDDHHPNL